MILIVEDDVLLAQTLKTFLESQHMSCVVAVDGEEALSKIAEYTITGMIVDMMMPKMDGVSLLSAITHLHPKPFIIMSTALGSLEDKAKAFELGADDYLVKPYHFKELGFRIQALLKRTNKDQRHQLIFDHSFLDEQQLLCKVHDQSIVLSKKEFQVLFHLLKHPQTIFTRNQLLDLIWGESSLSYDRTVDTHIKSIREKVKSPDFEIVTIRGLGYKGVLL
ncbi:MAG: response regulator transcription factor [Erysipelothrix sp.]|jgi:DNA-binding response OmpR family regulator|nr:response regulator transcription factor [Erysipelothrix sp.]